MTLKYVSVFANLHIIESTMSQENVLRSFLRRFAKPEEFHWSSEHEEMNAGACLERVNVPKSLILKETETYYTIVKGTLNTWMGTFQSFGSL